MLTTHRLSEILKTKLVLIDNKEYISLEDLYQLIDRKIIIVECGPNGPPDPGVKERIGGP